MARFQSFVKYHLADSTPSLSDHLRDMAVETPQSLFVANVLDALKRIRGVHLDASGWFGLADGAGRPFSSIDRCLRFIESELHRRGHAAEGEAIGHVAQLCATDVELGGLGIVGDSAAADERALHEVEFLVDAWLSAISSREASAQQARPALRRRLGGTPDGARPMTLAEKILAYHAFSLPSPRGVRPGDVVRVWLDWVIASEVAWLGMLHTTRSIGERPRAWRNDRFWLTGDHAVDPRNYHEEKSRMLREELRTAKRELKMTENQGSNVSPACFSRQGAGF